MTTMRIINLLKELNFFFLDMLVEIKKIFMFTYFNNKMIKRYVLCKA